MAACPFVSIVVPAHNETDSLGTCLEGLLAQDYPARRREIIVIDNGSTDDTGAVLSRYPVIALQEPRQGSYLARNRGIRQARGEIIAFIDADCQPRSSTWLRSLIDGHQDPAVGAFVGEFQPLSTQGIIEGYVDDRGLIRQETLLKSDPPSIAAGNAAYRKSVFEKIGLFQSTNHFGADSELTLRMIRDGSFRIRYNPEAVVYHPHPAALIPFLRRTYQIGIGLAVVRRTHPDAFPARLLCPARYGRVALSTFAGLARYPLLVAALRRKGRAWRKCLLYPLLDKGHALALVTGIRCGLKDLRDHEIPGLRATPFQQDRRQGVLRTP